MRTEQQASQSTIYGKHFNKREIKGLITDFKKRALHALFFVPIRKIEASYPGPNNQDSWVVEKCTEDLPDFSGVVGIQCSSPQGPKLVQWSVLFRTIPHKDIPPQFHECLSIHKIQAVSIGIAGALDTPLPPHHRPFFGLPLLDTIALPIHLHCTFILSDDRRSVRYDEKGEGNIESQFNKWLLTERVPLLYLQFLAGWDHTHLMKDCPWWPRGTEPDTLSQAVVQAMQTTLPESDELVCDSHSGQRIAPSKAYFLQPPCPEGLLLKLLPEGLTIIPPGFSRSSSLQNVDNNYLITILRREAPSIISMYEEGRITVSDVVDVARFLELSSLADSLGLPLLPLADGTLASLSTEHTTFYYPPQKHKNPFPAHYFLDSTITKPKDRAIYSSLQVRHLDSVAISKLIMTKIPERDTFSSSPILEAWFKELWEFFDATYTAIEDPAFQWLPLIPTYSRSGTPTRISFQKLAGSEVIFVDRPTDVPLDACVALGMKLVRADACTRRLAEVVRSRGDQYLGICRAVIGFFMNLPPGQISLRFQRLSHELHSAFSQWFRKQLGGNSRFPPAELAVLEQLPLWEAAKVGPAPARFVSASAAFVIPEGIGSDVVQTWTKESTAYVPADHLLRSLMKEPVTLPTFYANHLSFPPAMTVTPAYKSLLKKVLSSSIPQESILVPNGNGRMSSSSELYLSSNATFANGFASQTRGKFLHPDLRDLEPQLRRWGLISAVTVPSFEACALTIHQDLNTPDILARALIVFRTYNTEMPLRLVGNYDAQNALRNTRFIPRHVGSTRYGSIPTDRYHSLPNIVSPSEIVNPKFFSVVWTQRAMCLEEPSPNLLLANDSVWKPTVTEVVCFFLFRHLLFTHCFQIKHLYLLSIEIAPDLPCNPELIKDLKATYSWLADHENEVEGLLDYNRYKLFLNVDNPNSEWKWDSASELLFDERDSSNTHRVKQFLKNYSGLLRVAGVKEINHVSVPNYLLHEDSPEIQLAQIRDSLNKMREADQLTDVIFIAKDGTEFPAHRVFLAARSGHFQTYFTLGWRESRLVEGNLEIDVEYGRECLEAVLGMFLCCLEFGAAEKPQLFAQPGCTRDLTVCQWMRRRK